MERKIPNQTANLWGSNSSHALRHKWLGGQESEALDRIGEQNLNWLIRIIERRRGHYIYQATDLPPLEVNPKSHHVIP